MNHSSNPHTPLSMAAVYETAEALMARHGSTTTLEVKNGLRNQGFWALQADVSEALRALAHTLGWTFTSNGRFRTYYCGSAPAPFDVERLGLHLN